MRITRRTAELMIEYDHGIVWVALENQDGIALSTRLFEMFAKCPYGMKAIGTVYVEGQAYQFQYRGDLDYYGVIVKDVEKQLIAVQTEV